MMNFDQRVGDLVRSVTSLKGRSHHGRIIRSQILTQGVGDFKQDVGSRRSPPVCGSRLRKNDGMRKQYNFRPSANGLDAWDVDNSHRRQCRPAG